MKFHLSAFLHTLKLVAPVLLTVVPNGDKLQPHVQRITEAIEQAEQIQGATGAEKKAHVLNIVRAAAVETHQNPDELAAIASHGIDTVVGAINLANKPKGPNSPGD